MRCLDSAQVRFQPPRTEHRVDLRSKPERGDQSASCIQSGTKIKAVTEPRYHWWNSWHVGTRKGALENSSDSPAQHCPDGWDVKDFGCEDPRSGKQM